VPVFGASSPLASGFRVRVGVRVNERWRGKRLMKDGRGKRLMKDEGV